MDNAYFKLGIDYEPVYAYIWKQNPDIRELTSESCFHLHKIPDSVYFRDKSGYQM